MSGLLRRAAPPVDLRRWAVDEALPFWAARGWDSARGGFFERLHTDGTPDAGCLRRLRVQARQVYVFAHAHHLGWCDGLGLALDGFGYLMDKGHAPDGAPGFVHLLTADGAAADPLRDAYDHIFVVLAAAWLARVSGDAQVRKVALDTLAFIDEALTDRAGDLLEGRPHRLPRRQNPAMHMFETMLVLHETLALPEALPRAAALRAMMERRFLDPETGALREFFSADWTPLQDVCEPGHMAEWSWLLRRHDALRGRPADAGAEALPRRLMARALEGANPATGFVYDETDLSGRPRRATHRTWGQTELVKAWLAEHEAGRPGARDEAIDALARLHAGYLAPAFPGGWIDQLDAAGAAIPGPTPASTFYHLLSTAAEADRVLGAAGALPVAAPIL